MKLNKASIGKGAAYLYIEQIFTLFFAYLFWLFLTKITTTEVIGLSATVISLATIFTTVLSLGIPGSIARFLGRNFLTQQIEDSKTYVNASFLVTAGGIAACSSAILLMKDYWILEKLDLNLIILTVLLMASTAIATLFRYILISSLNTKVLALQPIVSSVFKFAVSFILIFLGIGATGLALGYTSGQAVAVLVMGFAIFGIFKQTSKKRSTINLSQACKNLLVAGMPSWIPALVTTIGAQIGTIIIFGSTGTSEAGTYYIAFSISQGISSISYSLLSTAFPVLSAMQDGRKRLTWRLIKISLIFAVPLSLLVTFYSQDLLALLGEKYRDEAFSLGVLLLSTLPLGVMTGINILFYSYGNYRQVLYIGLASSVPRTALYFALVPLFGGSGAAMSYTIGSMMGFLAAVLLSKRIGMAIIWKDLAIILAIPLMFTSVFSFFEINYIISITAVLAGTFVLFVISGLLSRTDLEDSLRVLPTGISRPAIRIVSVVERVLRKSRR